MVCGQIYVVYIFLDHVYVVCMTPFTMYMMLACECMRRQGLIPSPNCTCGIEYRILILSTLLFNTMRLDGHSHASALSHTMRIVCTLCMHPLVSYDVVFFFRVYRKYWETKYQCVFTAVILNYTWFSRKRTSNTDLAYDL